MQLGQNIREEVQAFQEIVGVVDTLYFAKGQMAISLMISFIVLNVLYLSTFAFDMIGLQMNNTRVEHLLNAFVRFCRKDQHTFIFNAKVPVCFLSSLSKTNQFYPNIMGCCARHVCIDRQKNPISSDGELKEHHWLKRKLFFRTQLYSFCNKNTAFAE